MGLDPSLKYKALLTGSRTLTVALTFGFLASVIIGGVSPDIIVGVSIFALVGIIAVFELWLRS
ncbi:hypothetical protein ACO2I3_06290 [Leptospira interrogans]